MLHRRSSILGFALLLSISSFAAADESRDEDLPPPGMVKVEQTDLVPEPPPSRDYTLKPYRERRGHWGMMVGLDYNSYQPVNYTPNYVTAGFGDVYGFPQTPLLELQAVVKRNFSFGSAGIEAGFGYYDNVSQGIIDSELQLYQFRIGAIVILDTLFDIPYVAPYGSAGAYVMGLNESMGNNSVSGNTTVAPYLTLGLQMTLDWIEKDSARRAYESAGVQSTFLFAEVRMYFASSSKSDPDFSNNFAPGGGLRVEF